jgi:hypothetical protein
MIDLDLDGWLDLIAVNGHVYPESDGPETGTTYKQTLLAFRNTRDGRFVDIAPHLGLGFATRYAGRGAAVGDYDNDGDLDLLINTIDGNPALLNNRGAPRTNWISIELRSPQTIGARIWLRAGGITQMREINSQSGYLSSSAKRAHFGVRGSTEVEQITIQWPSGKRQVLRGIRSSQHLTVAEPHP